MKRVAVGILLLSLCLGVPVPDGHADQIVIVSDDWCPINCDPGTQAPGFMVEFAKIIFAKAGHSVEYKQVPWTRAVMEARKGNYHGIIGAYRGDAPDFIFPENEQAVIGNSFFVLRDSTWTYTGLPSLDRVKIGLILGYDYGEEIDQYTQKNKDSTKVQMNSGEKALEKNIKKLLAGRIDAVLENNYVFEYKASRMNIMDKIKPAGVAVQPDKAYIAFSPAHHKSKEYAEILSRGMEEIRASGELAKILEQYGLKDWK
ncbi:MAG: substrate-binding periplasmic protein [Thermodesulfobacteriota bacterium]